MILNPQNCGSPEDTLSCQPARHHSTDEAASFAGAARNSCIPFFNYPINLRIRPMT